MKKRPKRLESSSESDASSESLQETVSRSTRTRATEQSVTKSGEEICYYFSVMTGLLLYRVCQPDISHIR